MGKIRRERQKFHLTRDRSEETIPSVVPVVKSIPGKPEISVNLDSSSSNIFAGIKISLPDLQQTLTPVSIVPKVPLGVKSEGSIIFDNKGKQVSKKEKRRIRHEQLLRKIDTVQKLKQEAKERMKRKKTVVTGDMKPLIDALPTFVPRPDPKAQLESQKKIEKEKRRKRPLLPKKQRKKKELEDMKMFRTILSNPHYKADPGSAISNHIIRTITEDCIKNS